MDSKCITMSSADMAGDELLDELLAQHRIAVKAVAHLPAVHFSDTLAKIDGALDIIAARIVPKLRSIVRSRSASVLDEAIVERACKRYASEVAKQTGKELVFTSTIAMRAALECAFCAADQERK